MGRRMPTSRWRMLRAPPFGLDGPPPTRSPCGQLALVPGLAGQYPPEGSGGEDPGFFPGPAAPRRRGVGCGASHGGPVTVWLGMRLRASGRPIVARRHKPLRGCRVRLVGDSRPVQDRAMCGRVLVTGPLVRAVPGPGGRGPARDQHPRAGAYDWLGAGVVPSWGAKRPTPAALGTPPSVRPRPLAPVGIGPCPPRVGGGVGASPLQGLVAATRSCAGWSGINTDHQ